MGCGGPVPGEFGAEGGRILGAGPRPDLPALRRSALRAAARATGEGGHLGAPRHLAHRRPQGLPGRRRPVPHAELPLRLPAAAARRQQRRQGRQRGDGRHREAQPAARGRAAAQLPDLQRHPAEGTAEESLRDSRQPRLRRLRAHLRILPRPVRPHRGAEGRRVLHPGAHRAPHGRDPRTLPRPHPRPRLRLRRHVRPVRALRRRAQEEPLRPSSPSSASRRPTKPGACAA